jgi:hypothetical protein
MSYQKNAIKDPYLKTMSKLGKISPLIFKSLLKLAGNKRSRYSSEIHTETIILLCQGKSTHIYKDVMISLEKPQ